MPTVHDKYTRNGHTFDITETGQKVYKSFVGQKNVDLGNDVFAPYVWDETSQSIRYGDLSCEFYSGGYQVVREFGSVETLIDDQLFELQYWRNNKWVVLDLWQVDLTVDQQDDQCIVTRNLSDGEGNTLDVDFLFKPMEKVKLTFRLHVVDANLYQIRFQNSGIAGEVTEIPLIDRFGQGENLGINKLLFDNIKFQWGRDEIGIHEGYIIEDQAGGKKLDFFLGDFVLPADGDVIISPTTWGATENTDDCMDYDGTEYFDDYDGQLFVGDDPAYPPLDVGWIWTNVVADGTAENGCKISIDGAVEGAASGHADSAILKAVNDNTPPAWGAGELPINAVVHAGSVSWNPSGDGDQDSPEIKTIIQERFDGSHVSGNSLAIVWLEDGSSTDNQTGFDSSEGGIGAELTIVYTAVSAAITGTAQTDSITEADVVAGGETIIITLTNDTWIAA